MTVAERELHIPPKITEIEDFSELKKYACARVNHMKEWYLQCLDCVQQQKCSAGKQAIVLMDNSTAPKKPDIPDPKKNLRGYIEYIFTQEKDPVRFMLENSGNIKPQSIYQRVYLWKKNFPDLESRFHMLEKFQWVWTSPWNSMRIPDILTAKYSEKKTESKAADIPKKETPKPIAAKPKPSPALKDPPSDPKTDFGGKYANYPVVNVQESTSDCVALEDFLKELTGHSGISSKEPIGKPGISSKEQISKPIVDSKEPSEKLKEEMPVEVTDAHMDISSGVHREVVCMRAREVNTREVGSHEVNTCEVGTREVNTREVSSGGESRALEDILQKLRENISEYEQKIQEARDKISAILTVQQMMKNGV